MRSCRLRGGNTGVDMMLKLGIQHKDLIAAYGNLVAEFQNLDIKYKIKVLESVLKLLDKVDRVLDNKEGIERGDLIETSNKLSLNSHMVVSHSRHTDHAEKIKTLKQKFSDIQPKWNDRQSE